MIAAVARNRVIGRAGALPWHLPGDLAHFRRTTLHKPLIMGRRTYESIGKPLPLRENVVVTRDATFTASGCTVAHSVSEALALCADRGETIVIGGASLYTECLERAERLYLTQVHADLEGDVWFPALDLRAWNEVERREFAADARHAHAFSIVTLERAR